MVTRLRGISRTECLAASALIALGVIDVTMTAWALPQGAVELNPVAAFLWRYGGSSALALYKLAGIALMLATVAVVRGWRRVLAWGVMLVLSAVPPLWNTAVMIGVIR